MEEEKNNRHVRTFELDVSQLDESLRRFVRTEPVKVGVCVVTYKRPRGLLRCLQSLQLLQFSRNPQPDISIFVVDNDPNASAQPIVQQLQPCSKWPITYSIEPTRGISYARNHAVALAKHCDFIAFIDDDEYADPSWLDELLYTQRLYNADVVAGSIIPQFEEGTPEWIKRAWPIGRLRDMARTGDRIGFATTGNCLLRTSSIIKIPGPFDPRLALTGGSDRLLTLQMSRSGHRLVWCKESSVYEVVPHSRGNLGWMIRRSYRTGNDSVLCEKLMPKELRKNLLVRALRSWVTIVLEVPRILLLLLRHKRAEVIEHLLKIAQSWGVIMGLLGFRYEEYRRIHGT